MYWRKASLLAMAFLLPSRQIVTTLTTKDTRVSSTRACSKRMLSTGRRKAAYQPMNRYVTRGHSTSLGLTGGMGSLFSAPVLPADRHTRTEQPATSAINRQSESRSLVKRARRTTSSRSATPAVIAAVSAICTNGKTDGLVAIVSSSSLYEVRTAYSWVGSLANCAYRAS